MYVKCMRRRDRTPYICLSKKAQISAILKAKDTKGRFISKFECHIDFKSICERHMKDTFFCYGPITITTYNNIYIHV